ncbi:aminotransferase class I/II-fold pyridoxal phosphate-dependent enzyme, partial [Streptomyces nanhaiensis]|uniref:aminotransferase class I/II-fold pyridoxal phosphate-dependent enzyme n=1 Tax=Streptomyces nanhaiensis TaxID=679319 RepID=UPI00399CBA34
MQQTRPEGPTPAAVPAPEPRGARETGNGHAEYGAVAEAACGYWGRRGLPTEPGQVVAAPTAPLLLLALLAAAEPGTGPGGSEDGGGVVLPRPGPAWHADQARLLGRPLHPVPVPAECGGVPDPFALLETVGRARAAGGDPRVLLLSVADGLTGTAAPPELLHEVCEAAVQEDLLIISDESWRDTSHDPHDTVIVSPAEILHRAARHTGTHAHTVHSAHAPHGVRGAYGPSPGAADEGSGHDCVVVLVDLGADPEYAFRPGTAMGVARLPATGRGRELRERTRAVLKALRAHPRGREVTAAAEALGEAEPLREHRAA